MFGDFLFFDVDDHGRNPEFLSAGTGQLISSTYMRTFCSRTRMA